MMRVQTTPRSMRDRFIVNVLIAANFSIPILGTTISTTAAAQTIPVPQATTSSFEYDAEGNLKKITDPLARVTDLSYDALHRMTREQQPSPSTGVPRPLIQYAFDGLDYLSSITDPRLLTTTYSVDGFGNQLSQVSNDTGTTTKTYLPAANALLTEKDARAETTTYAYDQIGRVVSINYGSGTAIRFEYDGGASPVSAASGHLTKMTDESGSTDYAYTDFGEVASKTQAVTTGRGQFVRTVTYLYGSSGTETGKLTSIIYPSGNRVNYRYNTAGRVDAITINPVNANGVGTDMSVEYMHLMNIEYAAHGPIKSWQWGNSTPASPNTYSRSFDLDGRVTGYNLGNPASTGSQRTLHWDAAGRITAYTHTGAGIATALDQGFEYDDLDRLTGFTGNGTTQSYTYDANGNRTSISLGGNSYAYTIAGDSNQLRSTSGPAPAKTNSYDSVGNLVADGTITYTYNSRGRMSSAKIVGTVSSYLYNGFGQRVVVTKTKSLSSGVLVYDEAGHIIGEYDSSSGATRKEFVYLGNTPVGVIDRGRSGSLNQLNTESIYYIYVDHLETPRMITRSADGKIVWRWDNGDPFGLLPPDENPSGLGVFSFNLRMPGQYYDKSTNLFYNYFRDYDPSTGRYVESDPIGLSGGINTYAYVGGAPTLYSDALGLLVTAVLDRNAGTLTVTDNDTGRSVTASAFTGGNTNPGSGWNIREIAAPDGVYYITPNVNPKAGHEEWFSLLQKKIRIDDTFYHYGLRRSGARLHWGGQSFGCVTVDKNTPGNEKSWKAIRAMIMSTKRSTINYHPDYSSFQWGTVNLPSYGTLTIK